MNDKQRFTLFWFACIPVRFIIGLVATALSYSNVSNRKMLLQFLEIYALVTASVFGINIIRSSRGCKRTGGLGGDVWWNRSRFVHVLLWALSGFLFVQNVTGSGIPLLVDSLFGVVFGLIHFFT